ncbi:MAG: hydrogenase 2 operon protein HybA [Thermodesulfobacteriota bacterium]
MEAVKLDRRSFLRLAGLAGATAVAGPKPAQAARQYQPPPDALGCLVDLTVCIGCRKCERACNEVNQLPAPARPFDDLTVLEAKRRPDDQAFTVINRYYAGRRDARNNPQPSFVKVQCMHCQDPACASACIVGALTKEPNGAVRYDEGKCIGCRYCMVACPFQIPAYEYSDPLLPRVRKCTFCFERIVKAGGKPGCAQACPVEAITFGRRKDLLTLARRRMDDNPGRYLPHIYGEHEAGGASWLYISSEPFTRLGFQKLPDQPMPQLTETIQHGVFAYLWAPLALFGVLGGVMALTGRKGGGKEERS